MSAFRGLMISAVLVTGILLAACGGAAAKSTADPQKTIEAILAQTASVENEIATKVAATLAANPREPTPTQPSESPTDTPESAPPQDPTTPPILFEISQSAVDGDDGNDFVRGSSNINNGRVILLPGFEQSEVADPMIFHDGIVFQVEVFDSRVGTTDGAGIQEVTFRIEPDDASGQVVYENRLQYPAYCVFGASEPGCAVLSIDEPGMHWPGPSGAGIFNLPYLARIDIVPQEGEATQWRWRFQVNSPSLAGSSTPKTAQLNSISVQDGVYLVDFETNGFAPLFEPGKLHLHFFFNTVRPDQAGAPGAGPWKLYPTAPGQPNTSPFTQYSVADRPSGATQMCILTATYDHSVHLGTGNCVDLPAQ